MDPPIFIIGSPRSGTTLLRLMLTCHRNIMIPPECGFAVWLYDNNKTWNIEQDTDILGRWVEDLMGCHKIETWEMEPRALLTFLQRRRPSSYPEAVSAVYEFYGKARGRTFSRWGDKNNFHLDYVETIKSMFPRAFFIHLVRDGRDVACSYRGLNATTMDSEYAPRLPNAIREIASVWKADVAGVRKAFESFGREQVSEIRYEALVAAPEATLETLCRFLGETYDEGMLSYPAINRDEQLEPAEFLQWKEKTLQPPMPLDQPAYLTQLSAKEIEDFEEIAGDVLRDYGYIT